MPQKRSLVFLAVLGAIGIHSATAFAQSSPRGSVPEHPTNGKQEDSAAQPAPAAPTPSGPTATTPATGTAAPTTPSAAPSAGTAPPGDEGDDLSMTFHSSRTADMQQFAEGSLQEIHIGTAKPRFALNLFGDMSFGVANRAEGNVRPDAAFAVGVFDMLFNGELDGKILATTEVTFQYDQNTPLAELERLHLRWKPVKEFFVEAGRFHTDLGYWNVAYHHGKWLQLSIERPRVILLHGGLVPTHWIGAQAGLNIPVGSANVALVGSVGSSRDPLPENGASHNAHGTAFTPVNAGHFKAELAGLGLKDLRLGVSGVYSRIRAEPSTVRPGLPDTPMDEFIGNAYIAYPSLPFTLITEGYVIEHRVSSGALSSGLAGAKWRTYAAFAMIGYTIGRVTPYIKGEYTYSKKNVDQADAFYIPAPTSPNPPTVTLDVVEGTVGTRIDTSTWSALKLEYRITGGTGTRLEYDQARNKLDTPVIHTVTANWSFGI
ncbi:hypothetical protein LZC95_31030 [Pendulispora brunnea]|uniref:Porin n=1 Tax=Pendulispora brunnea TaxID=2905690 RepID=A0ABZ2K3D9_9BACT